MDRRKMPNGRREEDQYNPRWCREKHEALDKRIEAIKTRELGEVKDRIERVEQYGIKFVFLLIGNLLATVSTLAVVLLTR